jgi:hypothetical protein
LLAERPELLYSDAEVRAERLISEETRIPVDVILLAGVDELDRLCAAAVAALSREAPQDKPILDLLGVLPADYLLSIYYALPPRLRAQCESDGVWAYHLHREPDGIGEAINCLESLTIEGAAPEAGQPLHADEAADFRRFSEALLRRALRLPHDLSPEEEALADAGERAVSEALAHGG